jgi:uncharacterized protein (TIGR03067 family)
MEYLKVEYLVGKGKVERSSKMKLDATKKPKVFVGYENGKIVGYGIYELDKDTLKWCFHPGKKMQAPAEFSSTVENGNEFAVFERLKE